MSVRPLRRSGSARLLVWTLASLTAAMIAGSIAVRVLAGVVGAADGMDLIPLTLALTATGGLVAARRPHNAYGWLLISGGLGWALSALAADYAALALQQQLPGADTAASIAISAGSLAWGLFVTFVILLYPTGRLPGPRWRIVGLAAGLGLLLMTIGLGWAALEAGAQAMLPALAEGTEVQQSGWPKLLNDIGHALIFPSMVAGIIGLGLRVRRADAIERLQLKWFAFGASLVVVSILIQIGPLATPWLEMFSLTALPIVIGIAILRWRLYDIDRIVSRTVSYALLTVLLAGIYLAAVSSLTAFTSSATGQSPVGVAAATLLAAGAFQPARRRIQAVVDRRFNRARYDAARIVEGYRATLREQVDAAALRDDLLRTVDITVQPSRAQLWLLPADAHRNMS